MPWQSRLGTLLLLTIAGVGAFSPAWSAEQATVKPPSQVRQKTGVPRPTARETATQAKTEVAVTNSEAAVAPASFSTVVVPQDSLVNPGDVVCDQNGNQIQVPQQNPTPRQRICRDNCLSRIHQTGCDVICTEKENARDWFNYIRGYGPVVWVRNGPELSCHPPSIPFAKRVGGATAPQWEGLTGIPRQREISPGAVYLIRPEDLKYRVVKIEK